MKRSIVLSVCAVAALIFLSGSNAAEMKNAVFSDCASVCPAMVRIDGGKYLMGLPEGEQKIVDPNFEYRGEFLIELPQHGETVKSFAIGRYDVTRGEFAAFITDSGYKMKTETGCARGSIDPLAESRRKNWRNPGFPQTDRDPVVCVSWDEADAYTAWLSRKTGQAYRLPTEAEWEYAARAGTTTPRFWGNNNACKYANVYDLSAMKAIAAENGKKTVKPYAGDFHCDDGYANTSPVGVFRPNTFGLYDMLGNVEQLVSDCLGPYGANRQTQPAGNACSAHVARGGSFEWGPFGIRSASRNNLPTVAAGNILNRRTGTGFRVARD
jgi:formylglycine-generating enzyme